MYYHCSYISTFYRGYSGVFVLLVHLKRKSDKLYRKEMRMSPAKILVALEAGNMSDLGVAPDCAIAGFVIGTSSYMTRARHF